MTVKNHIVILTPGFPSSEDDSTTIPALQVYLKALIKSKPNFDIKIITFQFPFRTDEYKWNKISVIPLDGKNSKLKKIFIWQKAYTFLKQIHEKSPIECIHSFWIGECSLIGERFGKRYQIKHLTTAMGQDVLKPNFFVKFLSKNCQIITLSQKQQQFLKTNFKIDSHIIPWGIDEKDFPQVKEKTIDILGVGSLNSIKNYNLFIEIIESLSIETLKVELIGEGHLKAEISDIVRKKNLENTITILGELPRENVLEKMARSKLLLHTSTYESFGYVFLESLYSGMTLISTNVGIAEQSEHWMIFKSQDDAILKIKKALSTHKRHGRVLLYEINDTLKKYCEIYNA